MLEKHGYIYIIDGKVLLPGLSYVQAFGKALKHYRLKNGVTQAELSPILGIAPPDICKLELGGICVNVLQLKIMCTYYNCTPQDVYDLAEKIFLASGEMSSN